MKGDFHNTLLPDFVTVHLKGAPYFVVNHARTVSGRSLRVLETEEARQRYLLTGCKLSVHEFHVFNCFFRNRKGSFYSFLIRDHADYKIENQEVLEASHELKDIKIYKLYQDAGWSYKRPINNLRSNSMTSDIDAKNINHQEGLIYGCKKAFISYAEFDIKVRFCADEFKYSFASDGSILIDDLELLEV